MKSRISWTIATALALWAAAAVAEDTPAATAPEKPAQAAPATAEPAKEADAPKTPRRRNANDRLDLDTTVVTGNRELPKVLYIVPWKKADLGELPGQPFNSLLDEALTPVDRDVFRREVTYYDAVAAGRSTGDVPAPSGSPAGKAQ
ncbi:MAG: hypothetical protein ABW110_19870 [Steroidobacteraceae bacterium]